jgi:hypothetical protein
MPKATTFLQAAYCCWQTGWLGYIMRCCRATCVVSTVDEQNMGQEYMYDCIDAVYAASVPCIKAEVYCLWESLCLLQLMVQAC